VVAGEESVLAIPRDTMAEQMLAKYKHHAIRAFDLDLRDVLHVPIPPSFLPTLMNPIP
jgi:hypothetical protein